MRPRPIAHTLLFVMFAGRLVIAGSDTLGASVEAIGRLKTLYGETNSDGERVLILDLLLKEASRNEQLYQHRAATESIVWALARYPAGVSPPRYGWEREVAMVMARRPRPGELPQLASSADSPVWYLVAIENLRDTEADFTDLGALLVVSGTTRNAIPPARLSAQRRRLVERAGLLSPGAIPAKGRGSCLIPFPAARSVRALVVKCPRYRLDIELPFYETKYSQEFERVAAALRERTPASTPTAEPVASDYVKIGTVRNLVHGDFFSLAFDEGSRTPRNEMVYILRNGKVVGKLWVSQASSMGKVVASRVKIRPGDRVCLRTKQ